MAKERRSRYEPGRRVATWLKLKNRPEQEFVIGGYLPGGGQRRRCSGSVTVGYHEDGALRYAGRVGSGFDAVTRSRLQRLLDIPGRDRNTLFIRHRRPVRTCAAWSGRNRRS